MKANRFVKASFFSTLAADCRNTIGAASIATAALLVTNAAIATENAKHPIVDALVLRTGEGGCLNHAGLVAAIEKATNQSEIDADLWISVIEDGSIVYWGFARSGGMPNGYEPTDFSGRSCDSRRDSIASSINLALNLYRIPDFSPRRVPQYPIPEPAKPEPIKKTKVTAAAIRKSSSRPARQTSYHVGVSFSQMAFLGIFDTDSLGMALAGELDFNAKFGLRASMFATNAVNVPLGTGSVETKLYAGRLDACYGFGVRPSLFEFRICGGFTMGGIQAIPVGFHSLRRNEDSPPPWAAIAGRGELRYWVAPRAAIVLGLDVIFVTNASYFTVTSTDRKQPTSASTEFASVAGSAGFGIAVRFR